MRWSLMFPVNYWLLPRKQSNLSQKRRALSFVSEATLIVTTFQHS